MSLFNNFTAELRIDNPVLPPGHHVEGTLIFTAKKDIKVRRILLTLEGHARTAFTAKTEYGDTQNSSAPFSCHEQYATQCLLLVGSPRDEMNNVTHEMKAGEHNFAFKMFLSEACPTSYEGTHGYIRYSLKAVIEQPHKYDHTIVRGLTILRVDDLNRSSLAAEPVEVIEKKKIFYLFSKSGEIRCKVNIPHMGFVPGRSTGLVVTLESAIVPISCVKAKLIEKATFTGHNVYYGAIETKYHVSEITIAEKIYDKRVVAKPEHTIYFGELTVPPTAPSKLGCTIIQIQYHILIRISQSGLMKKDIEITIPIIIGTIPIRKVLPKSDPLAVLNSDDICMSHRMIRESHQSGGRLVADAHLNMPVDAVDFNVDIPPPSYEECVHGRTNAIEETFDNKKTKEDAEFAPLYPVYKFD